jgi:hypothetical protein
MIVALARKFRPPDIGRAGGLQIKIGKASSLPGCTVMYRFTRQDSAMI